MQWENFDSLKEEALEQARFLIENHGRFSQPFRNRFDHTLRVLKWAERIHAIEGGDIEVIALAVIFHDTGWSDTLDHALIGAELVEKYLLGKAVDPGLVDRIASAVRTHNKRNAPHESLPIENLIVMDADFLDEVGVTTLVWDAMATAIESNPGYGRVIEKDLKYYQRAQEKTVYLKTETGKQLYNQRMAAWEMCLSHLRYELGLSNAFEP